jgi:hypothetical protein
MYHVIALEFFTRPGLRDLMEAALTTRRSDMSQLSNFDLEAFPPQSLDLCLHKSRISNFMPTVLTLPRSNSNSSAITRSSFHRPHKIAHLSVFGKSPHSPPFGANRWFSMLPESGNLVFAALGTRPSNDGGKLGVDRRLLLNVLIAACH